MMKTPYTGLGRFALVVPVVLLVVVLVAVVVANLGDSSGDEQASEPSQSESDPELLELPRELVEVDAGHSLDEDEHDHDEEQFVFEDEDHIESAEQLAVSLRTFEEGYRSVLRGDTLERKQARVEAVVHDDVLPYLNLEPDQFVSDMNYDVVARANNVEDVLGGLVKYIATGEVSLAVEVTFVRIDASGEETEQGTILKRSQWQRIDGQWLLMGADT